MGNRGSNGAVVRSFSVILFGSNGSLYSVDISMGFLVYERNQGKKNIVKIEKKTRGPPLVAIILKKKNKIIIIIKCGDRR